MYHNAKYKCSIVSFDPGGTMLILQTEDRRYSYEGKTSKKKVRTLMPIVSRFPSMRGLWEQRSAFCISEIGLHIGLREQWHRCGSHLYSLIRQDMSKVIARSGGLSDHRSAVCKHLHSRVQKVLDRLVGLINLRWLTDSDSEALRRQEAGRWEESPL